MKIYLIGFFLLAEIALRAQNDSNFRCLPDSGCITEASPLYRSSSIAKAMDSSRSKGFSLCNATIDRVVSGNCCQNDDVTVQNDCIVLNIEKAVSRALNSNRQLLDTVENLTDAQYGIDLALTEFDITITPNGETGYAGSDRGKGGFTAGGGIDFSKKFTTGMVVSVIPSVVKTRGDYRTEIQTTVIQPLLRGLGKEYQLANLRGAQFSLRTAYRTLYIAQMQLTFRTIQTLYEVMKLEKTLELNQQSHKRISEFYKAAKIKEKIGLSDALDVYRAEMELRHAEDALQGTEERLEEIRDTLRDLLALPLDLSIKVDIPLGYSPHPIDLDRAVKTALKYRIEIDQAEDDQRENERLSYLAKKNLSPELNLVLNYSNVGRGHHFAKAFKSHRENIWGIGLTTASPIVPVADQIAYEQSLLAIASASRGVDQAEATIIIDVKKSVRQLERNLERIGLQEGQIKTAQGELRLANVKFDHGIADNFNVIQAEKSLRSAELNYLTAIIDYIVGEFQLLGAMGLLIDRPGQKS